jgi:4-hydroxy-tetrahydrodipicolinate reductase
MIRVAVVGASGRSGMFVLEALRDVSDMTLHAAVVSENSAVQGQSVPGTSLQYVSNLEALCGADVAIEFTKPEVSVAVAKLCAAHRIPLLVATTGHSAQQVELLKECSLVSPLCIASNTSIGAAVLGVLIERAKSLLGDGYDIEVLDIHHRMKKDAPSGTALGLVASLSGEQEAVFSRPGQRKPGEVGIVSLRGGDVAGEHTVYFLGDGERVEVSHRVSSRAVFGRGAVALARKLHQRPVGLYSARDLIGVG